MELATLPPPEALFNLKPRLMKTPREQTKFWRADDIGQVDLLKATYVTHAFAKHTHDGYVIGVIEDGVEAFEYRGETHHAPAGSVVVINPDEVHTGYAAAEDGWVYRTLYPEADLLKQAVAEMRDSSGYYPYFTEPVIHDPRLTRLVQQLHRTLERSPSALARETAFSEALTYLIAHYADNPPQINTSDNEHYAVKVAQEFLEAHYADNISLEQLASIVGLSPFYLNRVFSRTLGMPPHAYFTQIRVERAKALLPLGLPLAQVAAETGFVDQSHLTRHFKRIVGVTPGQFAQQRNIVQYG